VKYFAFYDGEHPHQSLGQVTPEVLYRTALGAGAMIVDKFPRTVG
jgi:putative transposase